MEDKESDKTTDSIDSHRTSSPIQFFTDNSQSSNTMSHDDSSETVNRPPVIERLYAACNQKTLPQEWNHRDKCDHLYLSHNNLRVHYRGKGESHKDAAAIRTHHAVPTQAGIYYYEVKIISKGKDGFIGIGFSEGSVPLCRLPGWEKNSYGYHGDDGNAFESCGTGKSYGPKFTTGDTIGCGYNIINRHIFYTKNGVSLGIAFKQVQMEDQLYPSIGLRAPGEILDTNFGHQEFKFDIEDYFNVEHKKLTDSILNSHCERYITPDTTKTETLLLKFVLNYLLHVGYLDTVKSLLNTFEPMKNDLEDYWKEVDLLKNSNLEEERFRKFVWENLITGKPSVVLKEMAEKYPKLLDTNENLNATLKLNQFLEIALNKDQTIEFPTADEKSLFLLELGAELSVDSSLQSTVSKLTVQDVFSLVAYENPTTSPLAQELSNSTNRELLAQYVDSQILAFFKRPDKPVIQDFVSYLEKNINFLQNLECPEISCVKILPFIKGLL